MILRFIFSSMMVISVSAFASEMQHGFILGKDGEFASHLVASGHHSRQTNISGQLQIKSYEQRKRYLERRKINAELGTSYFLFQAQNLKLPLLSPGQVLVGHIIESKIGSYQPENIIVTEAKFVVQKVYLNLENPFFSHPKIEQIENAEPSVLNSTHRRRRSCSALCRPLSMSSDSCSISCERGFPLCSTVGSGRSCQASCHCSDPGSR